MSRKLSPGSQRAKLLRYLHGMRPEQWDAMLMEQRGLCYLCERPLPARRSLISMDHDHSCCPPSPSGQNFSCGYCRRGLACRQCNTGIGMFGDDPERMRLAADNLERQQAITKALIMTKPEQYELFE